MLHLMLIPLEKAWVHGVLTPDIVRQFQFFSLHKALEILEIKLNSNQTLCHIWLIAERLSMCVCI